MYREGLSASNGECHIFLIVVQIAGRELDWDFQIVTCDDAFLWFDDTKMFRVGYIIHIEVKHTRVKNLNGVSCSGGKFVNV